MTMTKTKPNEPNYKAPEEYLIPGTAGWASAMKRDIYLRIWLVREVEPAYWLSFEAFVQAVEDDEDA